MTKKSVFSSLALTSVTLLIVACKPTPTPTINDERYLDLGGDTVTDTVTNLIWQRCSVGQTWTGDTCAGNAKRFNWLSAMNVGKEGWRLPTVYELDTLVYCTNKRRPSALNDDDWSTDKDGRCIGDYHPPTIYSRTFPETPPDWFWSSLPYSDINNNSWSINFLSGNASIKVNIDQLYIRLVRSEQ